MILPFAGQCVLGACLIGAGTSGQEPIVQGLPLQGNELQSLILKAQGLSSFSATYTMLLEGKEDGHARLEYRKGEWLGIVKETDSQATQLFVSNGIVYYGSDVEGGIPKESKVEVGENFLLPREKLREALQLTFPDEFRDQDLVPATGISFDIRLDDEQGLERCGIEITFFSPSPLLGWLGTLNDYGVLIEATAERLVYSLGDSHRIAILRNSGFIDHVAQRVDDEWRVVIQLSALRLEIDGGKPSILVHRRAFRLNSASSEVHAALVAKGIGFRHGALYGAISSMITSKRLAWNQHAHSRIEAIAKAIHQESARVYSSHWLVQMEDWMTGQGIKMKRRSRHGASEPDGRAAAEGLIKRVRAELDQHLETCRESYLELSQVVIEGGSDDSSVGETERFARIDRAAGEWAFRVEVENPLLSRYKEIFGLASVDGK